MKRPGITQTEEFLEMKESEKNLVPFLILIVPWMGRTLVLRIPPREEGGKITWLWIAVNWCWEVIGLLCA